MKVPTLTEHEQLYGIKTSYKSDGIYYEDKDIEPHLDHMQRIRVDKDAIKPNQTFRRVASIPMIVVMKWMEKGINIFTREGQEYAMKNFIKPMTSDYSLLRTVDKV